MNDRQFVETYCHNCGTQRCEGIGTEWFEGCKYKWNLDGQDAASEIARLEKQIYDLATKIVRGDFVEVVRCKDCRYQEQCAEFVMISGVDKDLVFCSYGERRDT